jgi:HTH-type transcriptional regulator / antitoxin HigA
MTMAAPNSEYGRLLKVIQPKRIHSKKEHAHFLGQIETLMLRGEDNLTSAEEILLELLVQLVHDYEQVKLPVKKAGPVEMLKYLMEENHLKAADLPFPASRVSEILTGKRAISKSQARALAERFGVSPALFI